jgi:hypothetical protein
MLSLRNETISTYVVKTFQRRISERFLIHKFVHLMHGANIGNINEVIQGWLW